MNAHGLAARRAGIDTYQQPVVYVRADCRVCRAEGFEAQAQVEVIAGHRHVLAILNHVNGDWLGADEIAFSDVAWTMLGAAEGDRVQVRHPPVLESMAHLRAKVHGQPFTYEALRSVMEDVTHGRVPDIHLASLVTLCAGQGLDDQETVALTRAMVDVGERIVWNIEPMADKHCIGGIPGNRTTLLVVPIVAACGIAIPKTSSRAITSAAGTADAMETLAPVDLDVPAMRRVVAQEGGCIVWGGNTRISPADDVLIRVERPLNLDSDGLLIASILSKKAAAGARQVLIDLPVGPSAKVRSVAAAQALSRGLVATGTALGLQVQTVLTDGTRPVGRGIGPALEAMDVMAVLERAADAPSDLRERALMLAGLILEMVGKAVSGAGRELARRTLDEGRALSKFIAICEAQGGLRIPPVATRSHVVTAPAAGVVDGIDLRLVARVAKLAGAPRDLSAGARLHVQLGERVEVRQPLLTLHARSEGALRYALDFMAAQLPVVRVKPEFA
ncbi:thymidine phosphorylase family protein [Variovorax dokdonensis]|uniref:Putative thymidine phosphorylase n=2 Tax=Variovorax dokdonensis TaxID=344883 RepID=A0ABT7NAW7_9BURK|nr:thymidine phosphorylase family protein [Variovorax dokdonensis]MDM0045074.1 thymidine phosphorylase family protein [Variovorax dokdonensis]